MTSPIHVAAGTFFATIGSFVITKDVVRILFVSIVFHLDARRVSLDSSKSETPLRDIGFPADNSPVALLHRDNRADRNFREKFASSVFRQSDASVGYWMIRDVASVHSKIKTTQSHEIWHLDMIDGGTMVALLVCNHKFAPFCRITRSAGRTLRAIHRHAILNQGHPLQGERNFNPQPIWRWPAAEKNLCGVPVACFRRNIQRRHLV